jgi:hypothetical protein
MTRRQQNSHDMHAAVLSLLDEYRGAWGSRPPVVEAVGALRTAFEWAATLDRERRGLETTGLTAEKAEQRDTMEGHTLRLALAIRPYARASGDQALLAEVEDVYPNTLDKASDADAVGMAERVRAAAEAHLAALADYGVKAADVTALRDAIAAFSPLGAGRDATAGQREARTGALPGAFEDAREALGLLDDLIPGVVGDPTLTAEYFRVRRTDDR